MNNQPNQANANVMLNSANNAAMTAMIVWDDIQTFFDDGDDNFYAHKHQDVGFGAMRNFALTLSPAVKIGYQAVETEFKDSFDREFVYSFLSCAEPILEKNDGQLSTAQAVGVGREVLRLFTQPITKNNENNENNENRIVVDPKQCSGMQFEYYSTLTAAEKRYDELMAFNVSPYILYQSEQNNYLVTWDESCYV